MKRELTCICCPLGCGLTVELEGNTVRSVSGNTCVRGKEYAENECTNPVRIVTSTVMTQKGIPVSVKTDTAIPKGKMAECMKIINGIVAQTPVHIGDVLATDVFGSNIIATGAME